MRKGIIHECLKKAIKEEMIRNKVKEIVKEEVEKEKSKDNESNDSDSTLKGKRNFVTNMLKHDDSDKFDHAMLSYKLWPDLDEDSARSYFSKCVRGERDFSNKDITKLYELIRSR